MFVIYGCMRQRGRKSASAEAVARLGVNGIAPPRLEPPAHLDADERKTFKAIVENAHLDHFTANDATLLAAFVRASSVAAKASAALPQDASQIAVWATAVRAMATLSGKLRMCPSARILPRSAGRMSMNASGGPKPWEFESGRKGKNVWDE
jgi:hypothetical protein